MTYHFVTLQQWDNILYRLGVRYRARLSRVFPGCPLACPTFDEWVEDALEIWRHKRGWLTGFLAANEN